MTLSLVNSWNYLNLGVLKEREREREIEIGGGGEGEKEREKERDREREIGKRCKERI